MANPSKFPSALQRDHGTSGPSGVRRRGPTSSELAMMSSAEYKRFMQARGQWQGADKELISSMRNPESKEGD